MDNVDEQVGDSSEQYPITRARAEAARHRVRAHGVRAAVGAAGAAAGEPRLEAHQGRARHPARPQLRGHAAGSLGLCC